MIEVNSSADKDRIKINLLQFLKFRLNSINRFQFLSFFEQLDSDFLAYWAKSSIYPFAIGDHYSGGNCSSNELFVASRSSAMVFKIIKISNSYSFYYDNNCISLDKLKQELIK